MLAIDTGIEDSVVEEHVIGEQWWVPVRRQKQLMTCHHTGR
jgi:hypothetical protein